MKQVLASKQKALQINLDTHIYGSFAEIGAGQETVRHFFRAGGASGTIAKAMSAYDKDFSDAIYGIENDGRYVTQARLTRMLDWEIDLLDRRLSREKHPQKTFFSFANTVTTIDWAKKYKGHGWLGVKFQLGSLEGYNQIMIHIRFNDNDVHMQQEALGTMGVNLLYGAFYHKDDPKQLLKSLYDNIDKDRIEIDMVDFQGPRFTHIDNRLMSLQLVKNGMTKAVLFGPDGKNLLPAQHLYKKNILTIRGSFRPVTKVNSDLAEKGYDMFIAENRVEEENTHLITEITLSNLKLLGEINERDFLERADILCSLGQTVMISDFSEYYKLIEYFSTFTKARMGLVLGAKNLIEIFNEKYYRDLSGGILEAFGKLFMKDLKLYLYPEFDDNGELLTSESLHVHPRYKDLFKFFKLNKRIVDIKDYDKKVLGIYSRKVFNMIKNNEEGWEDMLPEGVAETVKKKRLFGYIEKT
jgi:hypothetical protein